MIVKKVIMIGIHITKEIALKDFSVWAFNVALIAFPVGPIWNRSGTMIPRKMIREDAFFENAAPRLSPVPADAFKPSFFA